MKLVTFRSDHGPRVGALVAGGILDLQRAHFQARGYEADALQSVQALIEADGLALAQSVTRHHRADDVVPLRPEGQLLAPIPIPIQIRDALCFWDHLDGVLKNRERQGQDVSARREMLKGWFSRRPFWYTANRFCVVGPDEIIEWPPYSSSMDYELEMGVVIGKGGRNITAETAKQHIFGYTIFNDFTARDMQRTEMELGIGLSKSKGFDKANALGPCIVTADEFDPYTARMISRINGEVQCDNNSRTISYRFEEVISWLSNHEMLQPGEIFGSGTVGGGCGMETGRLLNDGDVIELEIVGIGKMKHQVRTLTNPA